MKTAKQLKSRSKKNSNTNKIRKPEIQQYNLNQEVWKTAKQLKIRKPGQQQNNLIRKPEKNSNTI